MSNQKKKSTISKSSKSPKSPNLSPNLSKSNNNITIRKIDENTYKDTYTNYLVIGISGNKINNIILNTLRRVIMELIPMYAYDKKDIEISKNSSIYNNDYMRIRLCQFPIINIENNYETINKSAELEFEANITTFDKKIEDINILEEKDRLEKIEKSQNFTMYVDVKNTSNDVLNVTTDDANVKFYYKGKIIETPYKRKLLIIKLKPGEEFRCTAVSTLNIGLRGSHFMPNSICVFEESDNQEYKLNIESLKQLTELELIIRACAIIDIKLNNFLEIITKKIIEYKSEKITDDFNLENNINITSKSDESDSITDSAIRNTSDDVLEQHRIKGIIKIENESHTFGNLLSNFLQNHPSIVFAGYKIDHLLVKELTLGYKTNGTDIITIFNDIIGESRLIFNDIKEQLKLL
jgi:DNA-directed RNA polymerase subunit L